jgi:hypothetical protein
VSQSELLGALEQEVMLSGAQFLGGGGVRHHHRLTGDAGLAILDREDATLEGDAYKVSDVEDAATLVLLLALLRSWCFARSVGEERARSVEPRLASANSGSRLATSKRVREDAAGGARLKKDVREFIRRLEAVGLTVEPTPGHYRVLRDGKTLRKENGMPFMLPFSPDTVRWRRAAIVELRKLGIDL